MNRHITIRIRFVQFAAILTALFLSPPVLAEEIQKIGGATFIGTYADSLSLSVDNDSFFQAYITGPGDKWKSHISIRNGGKKDIQISFREIIDKLDDRTLLEALDLKILLNDVQVLYEGKYASTSSPVIDWFTLKAGQEAVLTVYTGFPESCGNSYQAKQFDTDWIFEVRVQEPDGKTRQDSQDPQKDLTTQKPDKGSDPSSSQTAEQKEAENNGSPGNSHGGNPPTDSSHGSNNPGTSSYGSNNPLGSSQKSGIVQTGDALPVVRCLSILTAASLSIFCIMCIEKRRKQEGNTNGKQA